MENRINHCVECIRNLTDRKPEIGITLGSGLGDFVEQLTDKEEIPFTSIEGFPTPTVKGHDGKLIFGTYNGVEVVVLDGRVHYYEGYSQQETAIPVRVLKRIGVHTLILSNACGGVNYDFKPGDLMLIDDHINMSGSNPLIGKNLDSFGERFPDMSEVYSKKLWQTLQEKAHNEGIETKHGVYMMYSGPSFETPAEIRAFRILGADAVGMSTVPEAIAARHAGMNVMGISVITNMAAGMLDQKLTHEEVLETAEIVRKPFARLIALAIESIQENQ